MQIEQAKAQFEFVTEELNLSIESHEKTLNSLYSDVTLFTKLG